MTVPIPPQSGPTTSQERLAAEDHGVAPDIQASLPDLGAMAADAESAGKAWCAGASEWADSPQGAGEGGFSLDSPAAADDWPTDLSFSHQGP